MPFVRQAFLFMSQAGVIFWLLWFGAVLEHVAMDSFESGLFLSCSTPAPKKSSTNSFKPGNSFRSEQVDNTKGNASIYLPWTNFGTLLAAIQQTNSNSRLAKPIKLPDDYHGRTCLRGYLRPCERCAVINGWTAEESAGFLSAALRD